MPRANSSAADGSSTHTGLRCLSPAPLLDARSPALARPSSAEPLPHPPALHSGFESALTLPRRKQRDGDHRHFRSGIRRQRHHRCGQPLPSSGFSASATTPLILQQVQHLFQLIVIGGVRHSPCKVRRSQPAQRALALAIAAAKRAPTPSPATRHKSRTARLFAAPPRSTHALHTGAALHAVIGPPQIPQSSGKIVVTESSRSALAQPRTRVAPASVLPGGPPGGLPSPGGQPSRLRCC